MEKNSQYSRLEDQIRECYGRVVWTHKTHEKCADILNTRQSRVKLAQLILSAITTTGILISVFGDSKMIGITSAVLSLGLTMLNAYVKQYDLSKVAQKHADAAINTWDIRERYLSLLVDVKNEVLTIDELTIKRDQIQSELLSVYKESPRTFSKAYNKASKALKEMEQLTLSDEEVDKFLPAALKKQ